MIRTKGEAGTGNIVEAVRHVRSVMGDIRVLRNMDDDEVFSFAKRIAAPYDLVMQTKQLGRLPVVHFAAGGVATPADAALMMQQLAVTGSSLALASSRVATLCAGQGDCAGRYSFL
ncbi:hypothetical protein IEQ34_026591 [Dendrobium chrysotoxum]|uniref:pyridoxal 5'-phosphate synthase (glutamine hydrolyzing) n=1 Tax=Dendrobium chrysotoxum TaxID=161865 RepID=A0AAV7FLR3_DENCH|nr:hypothetical protein IEQ34_026591 [Dendrobium chrysotoxum]